MFTEYTSKIQGANERERERESKRPRRFVKFLLLFFVFSFYFLQIKSPILATGLANSPWPMYNHDVKHTGVSAYSGISYPTVKWKYNTGAIPGIAYSAIGSDGTIYVPSNNGKLYALNYDGTLKWTFTTGGSVDTSPVVDGQGVIYIGSADKKVYAINSDGTQKWSYTTGGTIRPGGAVATDGTIYFGSYDNKFYAFNPDGSVKWTYTTSGSIRTVPAIADDGTIYFRSFDRYLYALNPDGTLKWKTLLGIAGDVSRSSPAIGSDGTIYLLINSATGFQAIKALNPSDGSEKWTSANYATGATTYYPSPSLYGAVIIQPFVTTAINGTYGIISLNATDGSQNWIKYVTPDTLGGDSNIAIDVNGLMYQSGKDGINGMNANGTLKWKYLTSAISYGYSTLGDGVLYAGVDSTKDIVAFAPWTLSGSANVSYCHPGDTVTITAATSMLRTDPTSSENNQVQAVMPNGDKVPLTYVSSSGGNTTWSGTWTVPSGTADGSYSVIIEASSVNVLTDVTTHFASAPTGSSNTGITSTFSYIVDSTGPSGSWTNNQGVSRNFSSGSVNGASSDNVFTTNELPSFSFPKAKDDTSDIEKYQIILKTPDKDDWVYIDDINPVKPDSSDTRDEEKKSTSYSGDDISVYSKRNEDKLTNGAYKWKVRAVDKAGNITDTSEKILRINTYTANFSKTYLPLTILSPSLNSKTNTMTVYSSVFSFYGITSSQTKVKVTFKDKEDKQILERETTANTESRFGINITKEDNLTPGIHKVLLSATNPQGDYTEIPEFTLNLGYPSNISTNSVPDTQITKPLPTPSEIASPTLKPTPQPTPTPTQIPTPTPAPTRKHCFLFICW